jgi:multiple antibiotic resistance protein
MNHFWGHLLTVFMGFFAIMNPIANTPVFLGLTADNSPAVRAQVARKALFTAFGIVFVFCLFGKLIFNLFGITLPAFEITGGLLVMQIGFQMLQGRQSKVHQPLNQDPEESLQSALSIAVSPLAVPILAGPGTIATAMNFAATGSITDLIVTIAAFGVLSGVTLVFFLYGERLVSFLGQTGLNVITRMMGLILAVIGVQMVINGITSAFSLA